MVAKHLGRQLDRVGTPATVRRPAARTPARSATATPRTSTPPRRSSRRRGSGSCARATPSRRYRRHPRVDGRPRRPKSRHPRCSRRPARRGGSSRARAPAAGRAPSPPPVSRASSIHRHTSELGTPAAQAGGRDSPCRGPVVTPAPGPPAGASALLVARRPCSRRRPARASSAPSSPGGPPSSSPGSGVPSGAVIRRSSWFSMSRSSQSSLWATTVRPSPASARDVQWPGSSEGEQVSSSPQLSSTSRENGTPAPSAMPLSSSTYCGSDRSAAASSGGVSASAADSDMPAKLSKSASYEATQRSISGRAPSPICRPISRWDPRDLQTLERNGHTLPLHSRAPAACGATPWRRRPARLDRLYAGRGSTATVHRSTTAVQVVPGQSGAGTNPKARLSAPLRSLGRILSPGMSRRKEARHGKARGSLARGLEERRRADGPERGDRRLRLRGREWTGASRGPSSRRTSRSSSPPRAHPRASRPSPTWSGPRRTARRRPGAGGRRWPCRRREPVS